MSRHTQKDVVPPFHAAAPQPAQKRPIEEKKRQRLSHITMLLGSVALSVSLLGGIKLLYDILTEGLLLEGILAQVISLALTFLLGWVLSLVCIRVFANLVLPILIQAYLFLTVGGILTLYARVAYKLYIEQFNPERHYLLYSLAIGIGFAILVGLHLLIEDHDLRPFSIPFLMVGVLHLSAMVVHYVFQNGIQENIWGDVYFFVLVMLIALLMLIHLGIFNPLRKFINRFFEKASATLRPGKQ